MLRILVIRLSSVGDIVHALPAVSALGRALPEAQIDWAIEPRYASLLGQSAFVHEVVEVDTLGWGRRLLSAATIEEIVRTALQLRRHAYDLAIDFQGLVKSAAVAWISGSPERIGLSEHWLKEPPAAVCYTQRINARNAVHVIQESIALVDYVISRMGAASGPLNWLYEPASWTFPLPHSAEDERYVTEQLEAKRIREFIIVSPGGGWKAKRWDPDNYAELVRRLSAESRHHLLLTGSAEEELIIRGILDRAGPKRSAYLPSTLLQFIALARKASLFVGGDTGPMHLAAAVGTPIVAIYGPTHPLRNGPFSKDDIAISNLGPINHTRRGTDTGYLQGITVDSVVAAVHRRLGLRSGNQK
jgi:lipopolysaccharide heptosyltransferase I